MDNAAVLLEQCVARLDVLKDEVAVNRGTAFFVAPGVALTCAHTILDDERRQAGTLAIYFAGERFNAEVFGPILWPPYPDLAALSVKGAKGHPFISIGEGLHLRPGDTAYAYGFNVKQNPQKLAAESLIFTVQGRTAWWKAPEDPTSKQLFIGLKEEIVAPGLSGAPVLSQRTGTVCAVVKHSRNYTLAHGGLAIPIEEAVRGIPNLLATIEASGSKTDQGQRLFNEAEMHFQADRFDEAVRKYTSASEMGHAAAQVRLGYLYEKGHGGLPRDPRYARDFYQKATDQCHPHGQFNLAVFYHLGLGDLTKDISRAADLYRAAADQEHAPALLALAQLYILGLVGGAPSDRAAVPLLRRAAAQGSSEAISQLRRLAQQGRGGIDPASLDDGIGGTGGSKSPSQTPLAKSLMTWPKRKMTSHRSILREDINPRDWMLCFVGDKQTALLDELSADLSGDFSEDGSKKVIRSGFSYWGLGPTIGWVRTTTDPTYLNSYEATASFKERWRSREIRNALNKKRVEYAYVSLGIGTGDKDISIIEDLLVWSNKTLIVFAVDISVEMLKYAVSRILDRFGSRVDVLAVQIDLTKKENLDRLREIIFPVAKHRSILYSLLGNTIANFTQDELRLRTIIQMMRTQDRMLIEVGTTRRDTQEAAAAAAREYQISGRFKNFATESLVSNTGIKVNLANIKILYELEYVGETRVVRSILLKVLYVSDQDVRFRLAGMDEKHSIEFNKNDTIRIYVTRKYTEEGFKYLLRAVDCSSLAQEYRPFKQTGANPDPYFGMTLYLAAYNGSSEHFEAPQTVSGYNP